MSRNKNKRDVLAGEKMAQQNSPRAMFITFDAKLLKW